VVETALTALKQTRGPRNTSRIYLARPRDAQNERLRGECAIRARLAAKFVVLIALTGWGQQEDRRKSKEAGFDGHLVKPVEPRDLMNLLASLHEQRSVDPKP